MATDSLYRELESTLKSKLSGEVRFDSISRILYSTDASNYQIEPVGVVLPRTIEDVITTIEISNQHKSPFSQEGEGQA